MILALATTAAALEVSLEENRGERGSIGYVDLQKVFRLFPETHKARQSFAEIVRQAEEQVNLKKAGLLALKAELSRLTLERELVLRTPIPAAPEPPPPPPVPVEPPAVSTPAAPAPEPALPPTPSTAPARPDLSALPGMAPGPDEELPKIPPLIPEAASPPEAAETQAQAPASTAPLVINIPGVTERPVVVQPPSGEDAAPIAPSTATAAPAPPPEPPRPSARDEALRMRDIRLKELDDQIAAKKLELEGKEAEFAADQARVEKNLIELEGRRSEILLGRIYGAVREVARESGVSVVVDKSQILFGQNTVDLTQKVVSKLEATPF